MDYKHKLIEIFDLLKEKHFKYDIKHSKDEIDKIIKEYVMKNEINDKYQFYYAVNYLIKQLLSPYDSHTNLKYNNMNNYFLPFLSIIKNDKVYIGYTTEKYSNLNDLEILSINGVDIKIILEQLENIINKNSHNSSLYFIEQALSNLLILKSLPCLHDLIDDNISLSLKDNNQITEVTLKPTTDKIVFPKVKNYSYDLYDNYVVIHYNICFSENDEMEELIKELEKLDSIDYYVLDLVENNGGNSRIFNELYDFLINKDTITLVSNRTFSSGIQAAKLMEDSGSYIIGSQVGDYINRIGDLNQLEFDDNFILEVAYKYFYFEDNHFIRISNKEEYERLDNKTKEFQYLKIDKEIEPNLTSYRKYEDIYLKSINDYILSKGVNNERKLHK